MKVVLRSVAELDVTDAALWYDGQRVGLGEAFLVGVRQALRRIAENPEAYPVVLAPGLRRILLEDFPYALFYLVEPERAVVTGCFHVRQSPRRWSSRA